MDIEGARPTFGPVNRGPPVARTSKGGAMRSAVQTFAAVLAVALIGGLVPAAAHADCGVSASLRPASDDVADPIVGMWKVAFIAEGNTGPGLPPDGVVIDNAFAQWHADGTEVMNSSRNPATQSFCLG